MRFCVAGGQAGAASGEAREGTGDGEGIGEEGADMWFGVGLCCDVVATDAGTEGVLCGFKEGRVSGERDEEDLVEVGDYKMAGCEVEGGAEEGHAGVALLAEGLAGAFVYETPFAVPGETFGADFPVCGGRDGETAAAFDGEDCEAFDVESVFHVGGKGNLGGVERFLDVEFFDEFDESVYILNGAHGS